MNKKHIYTISSNGTYIACGFTGSINANTHIWTRREKWIEFIQIISVRLVKIFSVEYSRIDFVSSFFYNVSLQRDVISLFLLFADYALDDEIHSKLFNPIIELTFLILYALVQCILNAFFVIFLSLSHPQPR